MTVTLTYDTQLSRVRVDAALADLAAYDFEVDVAGWEAVGGTLARSTLQAHGGTGSALLTPDGATETVRARTVLASSPTVVEGETNEFAAWVYSPNGYTVDISVEYFDAADVSLQFTIWQTVTVVAATWTQIVGSGAAPAGAVTARLNVNQRTTPAVTDELYIDDVTFRALTADVERSTDQVRWAIVRGGTMADLSRPLDDYEFTPDVLNYYRVRGGTVGGGPASVTPTLSSVWLKVISRPWLNTEIRIIDTYTMFRPARTGMFNVIGRSFPIAVSDVRGARQFTPMVKVVSDADRERLDLLLASGDPVYLHTPAMSKVPTLYATIGDSTEERMGLSDQWVIALPLSEIAAPGPDIVGSTSTYQTLVNKYATYSDLLAAHATYDSVLELVADPIEVIVP